MKTMNERRRQPSTGQKKKTLADSNYFYTEKYSVPVLVYA